MIYQIPFAESKLLWDKIYKQNALSLPFSTWDWHNDWYKILGNGWEPFCLSVDDLIVAPFARKGDTVIWSGGEEISDYQDLIGGNHEKKAAWNQILVFLKEQGIKTITLRNIPHNSETLTYFQSLSPTSVEKEDTTPTMTLPASWDAYRESLSHKYKHELERKLRKVQREHPDVQVMESTHPAEDIHAFLELMQKDEAKKKFLTPDVQVFFTTIAKTFSKHISLLFVTLGDKKIATTFSFIYNDTSYLYNSGFDKACCANAGFYLKAVSIERAIEKGLKHYNFLQGSERYKYELGGIDFPIYTITYTLS
jgi:hypothetical protein